MLTTKTTRSALKPGILLLLLLMSGSVFAHPGHLEYEGGNSMFNGLLHPLSGIDHLLALMVIGIWATRIGTGIKSIALPVAFITTMGLGLLMGEMGAALHLLSADAALLFLMLSVVAMTLLRAPLPIAACMVAVFGFLHGNDHVGTTVAPGLPAFLSGLLLSSALLHFGGWWIGRYLFRQDNRMAVLTILTGIAGTALITGG